MNPAKIGVLIAFIIVLGVPLAFRPPEAAPPADAQRLVIITPHNSQIRAEFGRAFDEWHRRNHGGAVSIDWRQPGGTSDIQKMLLSVYSKAVSTGQIAPDGSLTTGNMPFDLLFGGGSYEHNKVKAGVSVTMDSGDIVTVPISIPMGFEQSRLDEWFGANQIGAEVLFDPEQYWLGNALSAFGIIYNRDVLRELGIDDPTSWRDLTNPALVRRVALADPRQSGSVETTYDSILSNYGWDEGWRILRAMSANARYFSNSSSKVPIDVSHGEAAIGVAIDFYGRFEAQAVMQPGETPETARVGYIDPPGAVYVDADPISLLRGGPNPELALRFVEYVLSEEGQALWQFRSRGSEPGLGPRDYELRRMPVRRVMYEKHLDHFVDRVNPFEIASPQAPRGWRSSIKLILSASSMDIHADQVRAWAALNEARRSGLTEGFIEELESLFFAMPEHDFADGRSMPLNEANFPAIRAHWREAASSGDFEMIRIRYTAFFRGNYREIVRRVRSGAGGES